MYCTLFRNAQSTSADVLLTADRHAEASVVMYAWNSQAQPHFLLNEANRSNYSKALLLLTDPASTVIQAFRRSGLSEMRYCRTQAMICKHLHNSCKLVIA